MGIIDLTVPIREEMLIWPGDPAPHFSYHLSLQLGDPVNVTMARMGLHTGTHVDAPNHFLEGEGGIETLDLDVMVGPARVIQIGDPRRITAEELLRNDLSAHTRILIRTRNSDDRWWEKPFNPDFCHMTPEAAEVLLEAGVRLLGVDYLSVDGRNAADAPVHRLLLPARVILLEGLNLSAAKTGDYELIALPILFEGRDGAPVRAVLRR